MKKNNYRNYIHYIPWRRYRSEIRHYLLLLLLPLVLLVALYAGVYKIISDQMTAYSELTLDRFYSQSTSMLRGMELMAESIQSNPVILGVFDETASDEIKPMVICEQISAHLASDPYVSHAYLIVDSSGYIYSDQGYFNANSLDSILYEYGISKETVKHQDASGSSHILNANNAPPFYVCQVKDSAGNQIGSLLIALRPNEFLKVFTNMDTELCAIFNDSVYLSSYLFNINIDGFDWRSEADVAALAGTDVTCVYLDDENYTYMVAISKDSFYQPLYIIIWAFVLYSLAVLIIGYAYLYHISKKRYENMVLLAGTLPETYQGDESYQDIYDRIKESLSSIQTQSENHQKWKREKALKDILIHHMAATSQSQYKDAGLPVGEGYTFCVVSYFARIADPALKIENMSDVRGYVVSLFRTTIAKLSEDKNISFSYTEEHSTYCAVFFSKDADDLIASVKKLSGELCELLTVSYELSLRAIISSSFTELSSLSEHYEETLNLNRFVTSINSTAMVIVSEEMATNSGTLLSGDFIRQQQILINTILSKKYESVPSMTETILSTHVAPIKKNYELAQNRIASVANVLIEGIRMSSKADSMEDYLKRIGTADSIQALISVTTEAYELLAQIDQSQEQSSEIMNLANNYITQNLFDPNLNVGAICDAVQVSPQRLTRMFHSHFHMAIAEYVNALRIDEVKRLLKETDMTVLQIALQVGYTNTDTLTRNFKKIEGITPSEYRKL